METDRSVAGTLFYWCTILAAASLVIITVIICTDAFGRSFFTRPVKWAMELSGYILAIVAFFPAAYALEHDRHVKVDLITRFFSPFGKKISELAGSILGVVYTVILAWQGMELVLRSFKSGEIAIGGLGMLLWIPEMLVPVGAGLFALAFVLKTIRVVSILKPR